ncbi:efflux RND transporter permease subunit [Wohlfahrtiimonas larvae]|uniref:Efflux pump membrane transporter n=1 Tax=Wohlfahrtiimonas larvae TaxID=1157986 RepID=A0ABP9ML67_9GAMM|nr:efflux RND transporter permease subunit [Wohlfahrtiimonas larvae]
MSQFFIGRPIFAWVLAIVTMLAGTFSVINLPISQYPNIAPPAIMISGMSPGASAETVQDTVVQVIEQQMSALDGYRYMSSASNVDGSFEITITFEQGTDTDIAQVQVQNKLQLAMPNLPEEVQRQGVQVVKFQINFIQVLALRDTSGNMNNHDLGNYISTHLQDPISRIDGIGELMLFGAKNAMRIWLDPAKLHSYHLTPNDVANAIRAENVQVSSGQLGGLPAKANTQLNATIVSTSRMRTAEEFNEILLKVNLDGSQIRLKDVAEVKIGADNYSISSRHNGVEAAGLGIRLTPKGNLLDVVKEVEKIVKQQEPFFPPNVEYIFPYDTSPSVKASIQSVVSTIVEAIILVFLVMYLFLQNFRATLIPTLAVPVVMLGTFAILPLFGMNVNVLTMYAMVLAIGLLVDDAIVVVENVERLMHEEHLSPKEATQKSMTQIQGALVGIGLVLSAVFVPMAFFGGSAGTIYRQFSVTIVTTMSLSVITALIFTPALCATILKPVTHNALERKGFFGWFNRMFDRGSYRFESGAAGIVRRPARSLIVFVFISIATGLLFTQIPKAFLPNEDQNVLILEVRLPANATAERTEAILDDVRNYLLTEEADNLHTIFSVNGFNFAGRGQNSALAFINLKDWSERPNADQSAFAIAERAQKYFSTIRDGMVLIFPPPAIMEMGNAMGVNFFLQDTVGLGHEALMDARNQFLQLAAQSPILANFRPNGKEDEPQYRVTIDKERARALQLDLSEINDTMTTAWGSIYVNNFIDQGRVKRVYLQGNQNSRSAPEDFEKWHVRNQLGEMIPFNSFAKGEWIIGSPKLERYNGLLSIEILGEPAPGYSTGDAMIEIARIMQQLPNGIEHSYTGLSYEEIKTGDQSILLYSITVLMVFLCLAALYESWTVPISVIMVVPLGILGAVAATLLRGLTSDVYFQIGLMTTVGLTAKNAILIVEFARELYEKEGKPLLQAATEASRLRLRPIIMTSLAFTLGVTPMAISTGAGAGSQHSLATGVIGGMISATILAVFFVPLFYVVVVKLFEFKRKL